MKGNYNYVTKRNSIENDVTFMKMKGNYNGRYGDVEVSEM